MRINLGFNMLLYTIILAVLTGSFAGQLIVQDCTGSEASTGNLQEVYSPEFEDGDPIVLERNRTYGFGIKFSAGGAPCVGLTPTIFAYIHGYKYDWKDIEQDACQSLEGPNYCPIFEGSEYDYFLPIHIDINYPATKLIFQSILTCVDHNGIKGQNQTCFTMQAEII